MEPVVIKNLSETSFTNEDVVNLLHLSFKERLEEGLRFSCSFISAEEYSEDTKTGNTFVAIDKGTGQLIGTSFVRVYDKPGKPKYGLFEYLGVHPEAKRRGIASKLLQTCILSCARDGGEYILSDTSTRADSSVKFHFKNGFRLLEIASYPNTNYLSYIFRRPCVRTEKQSHLDKAFWRWHFWIARFKLSLLYKNDGTPSFFNIIYKRIKGLVK